MTLRTRLILAAVAALVLTWGLPAGLSLYHRHQAGTSEAVATQHVQEADHHVGAAQAIPEHSQALATAQADSDRAWAEVRRLRKLVGASAPMVPDPVIPSQAGGDAPADLCAEQRAADRELIEAQARQIEALKAAYSDERKRSAESWAAFEHERAARMAQEAATKAWKDAVTTSRWQGRVEGFAVGAALGYVGGRR